MTRLKIFTASCLFHILFHFSFAQNSDLRINNPAEKLFSFGLIADPQYADAETAGNRYYRNSLKKLENCISELNMHDLSFTLTLVFQVGLSKHLLQILILTTKQENLIRGGFTLGVAS